MIYWITSLFVSCFFNLYCVEAKGLSVIEACSKNIKKTKNKTTQKARKLHCMADKKLPLLHSAVISQCKNSDRTFLSRAIKSHFFIPLTASMRRWSIYWLDHVNNWICTKIRPHNVRAVCTYEYIPRWKSNHLIPLTQQLVLRGQMSCAWGIISWWL